MVSVAQLSQARLLFTCVFLYKTMLVPPIKSFSLVHDVLFIYATTYCCLPDDLHINWYFGGSFLHICIYSYGPFRLWPLLEVPVLWWEYESICSYERIYGFSKFWRSHYKNNLKTWRFVYSHTGQLSLVRVFKSSNGMHLGGICKTWETALELRVGFNDMLEG